MSVFSEYTLQIIQKSGSLKCVLLSIGVLLSIVSCKKDPSITDSSSILTFSTDTVFFDTVFTSVGSTTQSFKVHNPQKKKMVISKVFLAGGSQSNFRINIDGTAAMLLQDVEITANDSMFIFVEVTIDPNNVNTPLVVIDSIVFETNENAQSVKLVAWGQDAHFYKGEILGCDTVWKNDKPHVIYNSVLIDSLCKLTIEAGTQIYSHYQSRIFVQGTILVKGTLENPVIFKADRLEEFYDDLPGQWDGIHILKESFDNKIEYAVIQNAVVGIRVDSFSVNINPKLVVQNTIIKNIESSGILGLTASIYADNCLIIHCGEHIAQLDIGGSYLFNHCTFANYSSDIISHKKPSIRLNNFYLYDGTRYVADLYTTFTNCIIYGNSDEEIETDKDPDGLGIFENNFSNSILKTQLTELNLTDCHKNSDPKFKDPGNLELSTRDYHIDTLSVAFKGGKYINIDFDLEGKPRSSMPTIGCYERSE